MHLRHHRLRQQTALLLLAVFVFGGLLGPVLHRASHGLVWSDLRGSAPAASDVACDHDAHPARFEVTVPDLHDDLCPLCVRHLVSLDPVEARPVSLKDTYTVVCSCTDIVQVTIASSHLIRGPPHHA